MYGLTDRMRKVVDHPISSNTVIAVIIFSLLLMGLRTYPLPNDYIKLISLLDYLITTFFVVEITIRFLAAGSLRSFFSNRWNLVDLAIILAILLPLEYSRYALLGRLVRVFRTLLLFNAIPQLKVILEALWSAISRIGYISLMLFIIFYTFGILGNLLFRDINPFLWGDVGVAMLTLLRILTFDEWVPIMYETMKYYPWSWLYYLLFIFLSGAVFLNMLTGVLVDAMHRRIQMKEDEKQIDSQQ